MFSLRHPVASVLMAAALSGLLLWVSFPAQAQAPAAADASAVSPDIKARFNFRNARAKDVLAAISGLYGVSILGGTTIEEPINLVSEKEVDFDGALTLLSAALADLNKDVLREGRVVKVLPKNLLTAQVEMIRLQHASPEAVVAIINAIFQSRDLLAETTAQNQQLVEKLLPALQDKGGQLLIGQLKVVAMAYVPLKAVVLRAPEAAMPIIKKFIQTELDQPPVGVAAAPPAPPPKPGAPPPPPERTEVYKLKYVQADYLAAASQRLLGISLIPEPRINSVIIKTRAYEQFELLKQLIQLLDVPEPTAMDIYHITLNNAVAQEVQKTLQDIYSTTVVGPATEEGLAALGQEQRRLRDQVAQQMIDAGVQPDVAQQFVQGNLGVPVGEVTVVADTSNNALLIRTNPSNIDAVSAIVAQLDRVRPQVMIHVFIAEVQLDRTLQLGADFLYSNTAGNGHYTIGQDFDIRNQPSPTGLTYSYISDNITAFLRALESTTKLDVISRPQVLTLDNQPALIEFGRRVPLLRTTQITESGTVNTTVEYQSVSTRLRVTPHINAAGFVRLEVIQDIDDVSSDTFAISERLAPRVLITRKAQSQMQVRDGQTVCLGGFIGDKIDETQSKIPILGDLPVLGSLFKSIKNTRIKSELLIFITPHILKTPEELLAMTNSRRGKTLVLSRPERELEEVGIQPSLAEPPFHQPITRKSYSVPASQPGPENPPAGRPATEPAVASRPAAGTTRPVPPSSAIEPSAVLGLPPPPPPPPAKTPEPPQ